MIATRVVPGLLVYAAAAIALPATVPASSVCALALATVAPMSYRTLELTHVFRLNENLVAAASRYSVGVSVACTAAILLAAGRAATTASVAELSYGLAMVALCLWLVMSFWSERAQKARGSEGDFYRRTIKMVYKGTGVDKARSQVNDGLDDGPSSGTAAAAYRSVRPTRSIRPGGKVFPSRREGPRIFFRRTARTTTHPRRLFFQQRAL
jgi:hypothetical protein